MSCGVSCTDQITGGFTIQEPSPDQIALVAANFTVTGGLDPGNYPNQTGLYADEATVGAKEIVYPYLNLELTFTENLTVTQPTYYLKAAFFSSLACGDDGCPAAGEAVDLASTPLPPTMALFATGLGLLGFMGCGYMKRIAV